MHQKTKGKQVKLINAILSALKEEGVMILSTSVPSPLVLFESERRTCCTYLSVREPETWADIKNLKFPIIFITPKDDDAPAFPQKVAEQEFDIDIFYRDKTTKFLNVRVHEIKGYFFSTLIIFSKDDLLSALSNTVHYLSEMEFNPDFIEKIIDNSGIMDSSFLAKTSSSSHLLHPSPQFANDTPACVDAPPDVPGLNFDHIASSIVGMVDEIATGTTKRKRASTAPLVTIGLYGPWGAGKSTLIRALQTEFQSKSYTTFTINPWKWDGSGDIHAFVFKHFRARLKEAFPWPMFMVTVRRVFKALGDLAWYAFAIAMLVFAVTALDNAQLFQKVGLGSPSEALGFATSQSKIWLGTGGAFVSAIILYFWKAISKKTDEVINKQLFGQRPDALGAEGLAAAYQDIAAGWNYAGKNVPPFVFFFDDLDRCSPERVALFAETVHSLTAAGCVTFISCDEDYITAALNAKYANVWKHHKDGDKFGKRFLEKIVQIPYRVPAMQEAHLKELGIASTRQNKLRPHQVQRIIVEGADENTHTAGLVGVNEQGQETLVPPNVSKPQSKIVATLIDEAVVPLNMTREEMTTHVELIERALANDGVKTDPDTKRLAAFVFADRHFPAWLDHVSGRSVEEAPLPPKTDNLERILKDYLGDDKDKIKALYGMASMRLPYVLSWLLGGMVEALNLNIRQVKALSNTINLHLRIANVLNETEAQRIAAFVFADMHDQLWLDRLYHGLDGTNTLIGAHEDFEQRLKNVLGEEPKELLPLYAQLGRHPAIVPPGEPVSTD